MLKTLRTVFKSGAWAPLAVLATHLFLSRLLHAYIAWPPTDIPVHFSGGLAIAFLVSRCFRLLPRDGVQRTRIVLLELVLIVSVTATAAVFWEFAEFMHDRIFGTNVQVGLVNTMRDLAMGILGGTALASVRARQLRVWLPEMREIASDWVRALAH